MAMSDCMKCWETPCACGWEYRNMSEEARIKQASVVLGIDVDDLTGLLDDFVPNEHPQKNND